MAQDGSYPPVRFERNRPGECESSRGGDGEAHHLEELDGLCEGAVAEGHHHHDAVALAPRATVEEGRAACAAHGEGRDL